MAVLVGLAILVLLAVVFVYIGLAALKFLLKAGLALLAGALAGVAMFAWLNWVARFSAHPNIRDWAFAGGWLQPVAGLMTAVWVAAAVWSALSAQQS